MTREVTLPKDTRVFTQIGTGSLSCQGDRVVPAGTTIMIGDPQNMVYDHQDKMAVPFEHDGEKLWMLIAEMGVPELTN